MTKKCYKCMLIKPQTEFPWQNKKKNLRSVRCLECGRKYDNERYTETRSERLEKKAKSQVIVRERNTKYIYNYLLDHPCVNCGEIDIRFLQFDHINNKNFGISQKLRTYMWPKLLEEIKKCQVLCVKCHMLKSFEDSYRFELFEKHGYNHIDMSGDKYSE